MEIVLPIVMVVLGLVVGAGAVWLMNKGRSSVLTEQIQKAESGSALLQTQINEMQAKLAEAQAARAGAEARIEGIPTLESRVQSQNSEIIALKEANSRLQTEVEAERKNIEEQKQLLQKAKDDLTKEFEALSAVALRKSQTQFLEAAKETLEKHTELSKSELEKRQQAIDALLKPVDDKLKDLNQQITELEKNREGAYKGLSEQVQALMQTQQALQKDTVSLTQALKGSSQRGRWGEIQLRRLVELAEMSPYCDFDEQSSTDSDEGRIRPDLTVKLPNQNRIIVDSKVPFNIWVEAEEAATSEARELKMKQFAAQVKSAVTTLGSKNYWNQFESVEFVVMFLPGEHYLADALRADPELLDFSFQKRVVLATPTTLLGLLRTVHMGWQQQKMTDAAKKIADEGKKLHGHIATWMGHFQNVKKHFKQASEAMDKAESTANRGILSTALRLEKLGARSAKTLPTSATVDIDDFAEAAEMEALPEPAEEPATGLFEDSAD